MVRILFSLLALCVAGVASGDWPQFRGPTGQGHAEDNGVPVQWSQDQNVTWKQDIPGAGWSSPVVVESRVYLTTAVANDGTGEASAFSFRALCLDASTGEVVWDVEVFHVPTEQVGRIHKKNGHASPTPIVEGGQLFVHFGPVGTAALDLNGSLIWSNQELRFNAQHGSGGSPIVVGERLIFHCDGVKDPFVAALDRKTGEIVWRTQRPPIPGMTFSFATPLEIEVDGQQQIVCPCSCYVCAYDPASGKELWHVYFKDKWSLIPRPVFAHGLVYACTGYEGPAELLAIRPDGQGDVSETSVAWRTDRNVPHTPSVLIHGDLLFMVSDHGVATCLDAKTGDLHWKKRIGGAYSASPVLAGGNVYFANESGSCTVVRAARELDIVGTNDLDEPTLASYAVSDSALFIRSESRLYRIEDANRQNR